MNNKLSSIALVTGLVLTLMQASAAATMIQTNLFSTAEGAVIADDLWLSANAIEINGKAENDLFLLATSQSLTPKNNKDGAVTLGGTFENDVWALGNTILLGGVVQDHARLLARAITASGTVSNNAILLGNSIQLTATSLFGRDAWIIGENVILEGGVEGNLTVIAKSVTLSGSIAGNVTLTANDIVVLPQTRIGGDLVYSAPTELVLDKGVALRGRLMREAAPAAQADRKSFLSWPSLMMQTWLFLGALLVGAVMLFLFPAFTEEAAAQAQNSFWKCMLAGFVAVSLLPMACFFLALSIVGLPLALLVGLSSLVVIYTAKIIVAFMIGTLILRRKRIGLQNISALGLGLLLLYVAAGAGLAGVIVWFLIVCAGTGGMLFACLARRPPAAPTAP